MKVIICGAGKVGTSIAKHLVSQNNDVTVIDQSQELIYEINEKVDLKTINGSASNPSILKKAGAEEADMIIAVTLHDEINMVACQMAHTFFKIPRKIARLRSEDFLNPIWRDLYNADNMPIDLIISPELEVAKSIERQLKAPGAYDVVPFLNDEIELLSLPINENCPLIDTSLISIHELFQENANKKKDLRASILGINRGDSLFIPKKTDVLMKDDLIYILSDKNHVKRTMNAFGLNEKPKTDGKLLYPLEKYDAQFMSLGFLVDEKTPMIWRGPMVISAIKTLTEKVSWKDLDFLIIDMPPGTGDTQLTFAQDVKIDGAIIVSTPQELALIDVQRGIKMFDKTKINILGLVDNMSFFKSDDGKKHNIFGEGGVEKTAKEFNKKFLGKIPISTKLRESADLGLPLTYKEPDHEISKAFGEIADKIMQDVA